MVTLAQLGARTLRKLGVSVVAFSDQPVASASLSAADVVSEVLRNLGILVADADRPTPLATVGVVELGARTAQAVGINPLDLVGGSTGLTYGVTEVAMRGLIKLAVIASDETPIAQDQSLAVTKVQAVHDGLVAMDFVTWNVNQIPASVVEFYVIMVANLMAPEFGKPASIDAVNDARETIRLMALSGGRGQSLAEEKVRASHDALNSLGLVSWSIQEVPAARAEDYVAMAASLLAPVMGKASDKEAWAAAEARVRQAGMVQGSSDRALRSVQRVHAEMQGLGLVSWTLDAIPASMIDAYAAASTALMSEESGKALDPSIYSSQMTRVRMLAVGGPAGQALAEAKVRAVHYSLDARGRIRWTLWDIPPYAEEPYVLMAAVLLAPEFSLKVDPNWTMQAETELIRIVSLSPDFEPVVSCFF